MTAIHVEVTAEQIEDAGPGPMYWAAPVEEALAALTGQSVGIDGGGPDGPCVATIGQDAWTLVVDLPEDASAWLDRRWTEEGVGEPFAFDIEIPTWVTDLVHLATERDAT